LEFRRRFRGIDSPCFEFDRKEQSIFARIFVQPVDGVPVFFGNVLEYPYDNTCIVARCVSNNLAKMVVVGLL